MSDLTAIEDRFRKEFDELKLKPPKNSMPNLERELIIDYWRKAVEQLVAKSRIEEANYILDNCAYHYQNNNRMISPMLVKDRIKKLEKGNV